MGAAGKDREEEGGEEEGSGREEACLPAIRSDKTYLREGDE